MTDRQGETDRQTKETEGWKEEKRKQTGGEAGRQTDIKGDRGTDSQSVNKPLRLGSSQYGLQRSVEPGTRRALLSLH